MLPVSASGCFKMDSSMDRNVRKKPDNEGKGKHLPVFELDWTKLHNDITIRVFSCLGHRDRARLSATCKPWWILSKSSNLWRVLNLQTYCKFDDEAARSLATRCNNLYTLRLCGYETASILNLQAHNLREIDINSSFGISYTTFSTFVARHKALECIQIGSGFSPNIQNDVIKVIALSCPNLKKLWLFRMKDVSGEAIHALASNCQKLTDVGFIECVKVDAATIGSVRTLRFFSVARTTNIKWNLARLLWKNLSNLECLDVSGTDIKPDVVSELFRSCFSLKVMCALGCPLLEQNSASVNRRGKILVAVFTDILKEIATLFIDMPKGKGNVFLDRKNSNSFSDRKLEGVLDWLELIVCESLLRYKIGNTRGPDKFWLHQRSILLFSFLQSPNDEVQERAAQGYANVNDKNNDVKLFEAVMPQDVIRVLVNLARSSRDLVQAEAVKAITNLSHNRGIPKVVVDEGGVGVLINIARSASKWLLDDVVYGLCILSINHQSAFANAGGVRAVVDIIVRLSKSDDSEGVMEMAIDTLANLSSNEKCSMEIDYVGAVRVLVRVLKTGIANGMQKKEQGVIEKAAIALWHFTTYNVKNAMRIIDEDGVPKLTRLCSFSKSAFAGFVSALTLSNMFDPRLNELAMAGTSSGRTFSSARLESARSMASEAIQAFLKLHLFSASSSAPFCCLCTTHLQKAGRIVCRQSHIETFLTMLRHSSPFLISWGAFALHQFTLPEGEFTSYHADLLKKAGAQQMLLLTEASESSPPQAKALARIVLRNLEH